MVIRYLECISKCNINCRSESSIKRGIKKLILISISVIVKSSMKAQVCIVSGCYKEISEINLCCKACRRAVDDNTHCSPLAKQVFLCSGYRYSSGNANSVNGCIGQANCSCPQCNHIW